MSLGSIGLCCSPGGLPPPALWVITLQWWREVTGPVASWSVCPLKEQIPLCTQGIGSARASLCMDRAAHTLAKSKSVFVQKGVHKGTGASHCRRPATGAQPVKVHRVLLPDRKLSPHPVLSSLGTVWAHPFSPPEQSSSVITGA